MLVGFCLAVRRSVMEEIGGFDERFGPGMFEDNDLCYRMRRAGYRLVRAAKSYVHHHGSRTLARMSESSSSSSSSSSSAVPFNPQHLLNTNYQLYVNKWQQDLEFGYASHLSGLKPDRIVFNPDNHPDAQRKRVAELARRADVSLCMIVRDEQRVLADCLRSAQPFFKEMIVVDTGSKDRTMEIAREFGAKVFEIPWPDHFAAARNESLRHAKGKWIFWMDADDTLPWHTGEAILHAALSAPPEVTGYIIPVQFVENASFTDATRVDHVKLFRNYPDAQFEGRIHEQILPFLNARRGHVARLLSPSVPHSLIPSLPHSPVVLHSGYDNSPEGQARKRKRDYRLLRLDLKDRPNHPFVLFNFGMTDHYCGDHKSAIRWLKKCLKFALEGDTIVRKAYAMMALSHKHLGDMDACRKTIERGLEIVPDDPELRFHLANLHSEQGRFAEAREEYLKVAGADITGHFSSVDMGILGYKSFYSLGNVCLAMGNYVEAKDWFRKALDPVTPPSGGRGVRLPIIEAFFKAALENGDLVTARGLVEQVFVLEGNVGTLLAASNLGVAYAEHLGGPANAEEFLRAAIARNPQAVGPRLVLVRRLLSAGREQEAHEHLMFLNNAGVAEAAFFIGGLAALHGEFAEALSGWSGRMR